ncbi:MAG: nucleotidyltransferase [Candidatus Lokiarchaeota archaeon]|jgi:predicted nucleotidyltransferase|nr:nucleotidyltransferase [Candidatus Lokiarchaeota archaeon]
MDKDQVISRVKSTLESDQKIQAIYLFGSHATNTVNPMSDIDIAVLLDEEMVQDMVEIYWKLLRRISDALHTDRLDLVILNESEPALKFNVIKDGILVYDRDSVARVRFERRTINEYLDMQYIWKYYDAQLKKRLLEDASGD